MEENERESFLEAARIAADLVLRPEVVEAWAEESACVGMTVGGLAHHLFSQVDNAVRLLSAGVSVDAPIPLLEHYARAAWVHSGLDDEVNVGIREESDAQATSGPERLRDLVERRLAELPDALDAVHADDPVLIPWQGWSLTARDLLVTRMMEIVVHSDDLAASIGTATPEFTDAVLTPVLDLLTRVAVRRHGQVALVRALSRPQRAPESVSAF